MGFLHQQHSANKKIEQEKQKDLQNRANQFMQEYKTIRTKYRCDFQAYLRLIEGGQGGIIPGLRIVDTPTTKEVEFEETAEKQAIKNNDKDNGNKEVIIAK